MFKKLFKTIFGLGSRGSATLIELSLVVTMMSVGAMTFGKHLDAPANIPSDENAILSRLEYASRASSAHHEHLGVFFDSATGQIGVFRDKAPYNGAPDPGETLSRVVRLAKTASLSFVNAYDQETSVLCFGPQGAPAGAQPVLVALAAGNGLAPRFLMVTAEGKILKQ
ncbi:MAG: hypothetical protein PHC61_17765 [Chitinivibrionales bacterium]|nr:hypothetical protein [Chitinivibrionales bacterium]